MIIRIIKYEIKMKKMIIILLRLVKKKGGALDCEYLDRLLEKRGGFTLALLLLFLQKNAEKSMRDPMQTSVCKNPRTEASNKLNI